MISRVEALQLLYKYLKNDKMRKHCLAVEAIMRHLARRLGRDEATWGLVGLLHDLDYDLVGKDMKLHGAKAAELLKDALPGELLDVIAGHNEYTGISPASEEGRVMVKALQAADQASGLIVATALVMPNKKLSEVRVESLLKKLKSKDFARGVDRSKITGIKELGVPLQEFLRLSLEAMQEISSQLGL